MNVSASRAASALISLVFLLSSCVPRDLSKRLSADEVPPFLRKAAPGGMGDVEYFEKQEGGRIFYKAKWHEEGKEQSVHYSSKGEFLEKESDVDFDSLPANTQQAIRNYMSGRFSSYRLSEVEIRTTEEGRRLIDVEVATSDSKNPFLEISFTLEGVYVSEEVEHVEGIDTLN